MQGLGPQLLIVSVLSPEHRSVYAGVQKAVGVVHCALCAQRFARSLSPRFVVLRVFSEARGADHDHVGYFMGRNGLTQQCVAAKPGVHQSRKLESEKMQEGMA
jgi:hypothetical protein